MDSYCLLAYSLLPIPQLNLKNNKPFMLSDRLIGVETYAKFWAVVKKIKNSKKGKHDFPKRGILNQDEVVQENEGTAMNEAIIKEKLIELLEKLNESADANQKSSADEGLYVPERNLGTDDVVDHLRVQIKYLMFDLEATRRENRYLRQMIEMRPPTPRRDRGNEHQT